MDGEKTIVYANIHTEHIDLIDLILNGIFETYLKTVIRPLAKLSKAVKIADTSDQREAESKATSSVAVAFRKDTKPFDETNSMFNKDSFS